THAALVPVVLQDRGVLVPGGALLGRDPLGALVRDVQHLIEADAVVGVRSEVVPELAGVQRGRCGIPGIDPGQVILGGGVGQVAGDLTDVGVDQVVDDRAVGAATHGE